MADVFIIPVDSESSSYKIRAAIEDKEYMILIEWNGRLERWHMSLFKSDMTPLVMGLPLNIDTDLLSRFKHADLPAGILFLYDASGRHVECGRNDLGVRCFMLYRSAE